MSSGDEPGGRPGTGRGRGGRARSWNLEDKKRAQIAGAADDTEPHNPFRELGALPQKQWETSRWP